VNDRALLDINFGPIAKKLGNTRSLLALRERAQISFFPRECGRILHHLEWELHSRAPLETRAQNLMSLHKLPQGGANFFWVSLAFEQNRNAGRRRFLSLSKKQLLLRGEFVP
jgi:hypothetical protein